MSSGVSSQVTNVNAVFVSPEDLASSCLRIGLEGKPEPTTGAVFEVINDWPFQLRSIQDTHLDKL